MKREPVTLAYGGGVNSLAMLAEYVRRNKRIDLILFAGTGGEKPETYESVKRVDRWSKKQGYPGITIVRTISPKRGFETLEQQVLRNETLPAKAFGFKTCSLRYKIEPQNKFLNSWDLAQQAWARGQRVIKLVGIDAGETHRIKDYADDKYDVQYPLVDWDFGREECIAAIQRAGLQVPPKSACFFCPSMKKPEIVQLQLQHPDLAARALKMEKVALAGGKLGVAKGLGRHWSWRDLLKLTKKQRAKLPENSMSTDCACFDGEE